MERFKNFPFISIFVVYLGYLGYQYYDFNFSSDGAAAQALNQQQSLRAEVEGLKKKLSEGKKFLKSVDAKKADIQVALKKLSGYQGILSDSLDVAGTIKLLLTEAKKSDLKVEKVEPGKNSPREYYIEQEFKLDVRGTFQNIVLFTHRVSKLQRILRIESFSLKPAASSNPSARANQLSGQLSVRAYQYTMGKEDQMGKGLK